MMSRRALLVLIPLCLTFVLLRALLGLSPNSDFNVAGYNVHHLFTGLILIAVCGIAAVLLPWTSRASDVMCAGFGVGLALALDEWVYLIATDGTNASYLLPVSFWGGLVMVGLAAAYTILLGRRVATAGPTSTDSVK